MRIQSYSTTLPVRVLHLLLQLPGPAHLPLFHYGLHLGPLLPRPHSDSPMLAKSPRLRTPRLSTEPSFGPPGKAHEARLSGHDLA